MGQRDTKIYRERKAFASTDYADPEYSITINSVSGSTVNFTFTSATPEAGWVISQGGTNLKTTAITQNGSTYDATLSSSAPSSWTTGAATLYPAVKVTVEWNAFTGGAPGYLKQLFDTKVLTDNISGNDTSTSITISLRTDSFNYKSLTSIDNDSSGWGGSWGSIPWGGVSQDFKYRTWPPQDYAYFRILNAGFIHNNAFEKLAVCGWSQSFDMVSERAVN